MRFGNNQRMNKRGAFADLFIFMILAFVLIFICAIMIYIADTTTEQLHETMDGMDLGDGSGNNVSVVIDNTVGATALSFKALQWISAFIIFGMILSIFIGSYLVTTKPVFFIPYIFIVIIAIIVSVPLSNAYETLSNNADLSSTFTGFTASNFIMLNLPIWITIIGFVGGIIMFARMGKKEEFQYG